MSRTPLPFHAEDVSALARSLKGELAGVDHQPGHVELLNMLARAVGCRNFQHFRAQWAAREALAEPPAAAQPPVDFIKVRRTARHFDPAGSLMRWPGKFSERQLCLWVLWSRLPAREAMAEKEVNAHLTAQHGFGDYALLRRELVDGGWLSRSRDGARYERIERRPPAEAVELGRAVTPRRR